METNDNRLTFSEYQLKCRETALYPNLGDNIVYPTLGLAGETGEVAEKVKKILRDKEGKVGEEDRIELKKEMGDVLWYLANLATELKLDLGDVAATNLTKVQSRSERNKIHGEGDNR